MGGKQNPFFVCILTDCFKHCVKKSGHFATVLALLLALPALAGGADAGALKQQARRLALAAEPGWLALLHYKSSWLSGEPHSQADDAAFFLSMQGARDAQAEMDADLEAFLQPPVKGQVHAQCRFPARWHWLKQRLSLGAAHDVACFRLQVFLDDMAADHLTLVFPSMYLNNPGSSFGHTFLRFDASGKSVLFSPTLNYAAHVDHSDSLPVYIYKGLFGGYDGIFITRQYYETVEEYSNLENRDIWEYRLDLSPADIRQLARHIWEVRGLRFDYYFLRENCAYRLLALLDAVRPEWALTGDDAFPLYAIPVDTVRALDRAGVIVSRHFRPSLATRIQQFYRREPPRLTDLAVRLSAGEASGNRLATLDEAQQAAVLTQAYRILLFDGRSDTSLAQTLLSRRSRLDVADVDSVPAVAPAPPESGHGSRRLAVGGGEENGEAVVTLRFRPAFHDLLDDVRGFAPGAEINVLDGQVDYRIDSNDWRLRSLRLFNIVSISPQTPWSAPLSWRVDLEVDRLASSQRASRTYFSAGGGVGKSYQAGFFTPYAFALSGLQLSGGFERNHRWSAGLQLGTLIGTDFGQGRLEVEWTRTLTGFDDARRRRQAGWQFGLAANHALRFRYIDTHHDFFDERRWELVWLHYF